MNGKSFEDLLREVEEQRFSGWNFAFLHGRKTQQPLSWLYHDEVEHRLQAASSLLDLGTGGGELLKTLSPLPADTCATEAYAPNVPIATKTLAPIGVSVFSVESTEELPFHDERFDLIINRHSGYSPREVFRLLKPGGRFITQQVGGRNEVDLNIQLGAPANSEFCNWSLAVAVDHLRDAGFKIEFQKEEFPQMVYHDIAAVVFYLNAVEWQIPGFSAEHYRKQLFQLHEKIEQEGAFSADGHRFFLVAVKD